MPQRHHAKDRRGPPAAQYPHRQIARGRSPDCFDSMIDAALGHFDNLFACIFHARINAVRCAQLHCKLTLFGHRIARNNPPRARNLCRIDRCKAHATAPDDAHAVARRDACGMEHRACARYHRTAQNRGAVEWHIGIDPHARMLMHQHHFGIGRQVQHLVHWRPVGRQRQPWWLVLPPPRIATQTQRHPPGHAKFALPAIGRQARHHRIADLHRAHFAANGLDNARRFVPRNARHCVRIGPVDEMQVRPANPARRRSDQHFVRLGFGNRDVFDRQRRFGRSQDGSFHFTAYFPNSMRAMLRLWTSSGPSARRSVRCPA